MASTARRPTHHTSLRCRTLASKSLNTVTLGGSRTFHLELLSCKRGSSRCCPRCISSCASVPRCRRMRPSWLKSRKMISWNSKTCPEGRNVLRKHLVRTKKSRCIVPQCLHSWYTVFLTIGHGTMARSQSGHGPSRIFRRPALNPDKFRFESGQTPPRSGSGLHT